MLTDFDYKIANDGGLSTVSGRPLKIGILDIETTGLDAGMWYMLCACIKTVNKDNMNGPTYTVRIDDPRNPDKFSDKWLAKQLSEEMNKYDLIVHWYGSLFDIPFINTRCMKFKIPTPVKNFRRDLCFVARGVGKLRNNKLVTWGRFLFGDSGKTFLSWDTWIQGIRGDKKAIDYIVTHCKADVYETEKIYKRFMPLLGKLRRR